jgi:hypothetical protein
MWCDTFVTWDKNTPTTNWTNRGGDFISIPAGSDTYAKGETEMWLEFDMTDAVKDLHQNQDNNFGFILKAKNDNIGHKILIRSSETSNLDIRPKLVITCEIENQFSPVIKFISPGDGDTLSASSGNDSVQTLSFDRDIDTTDGAGITSVFIELLQSGNIVDSITITESPYKWKNFNSENYQDGEYTLKATTRSTLAAGGTSAFDEIQVTIHNNITEVNEKFFEKDKFLQIIKKSGTPALYLPFETQSSITISDILGRQLVSFQSVPGKKWYSLAPWLSAGMHLVTVRTGNKRIVKKMVIVE